jgi:hypothetical protein
MSIGYVIDSRIRRPLVHFIEGDFAGIRDSYFIFCLLFHRYFVPPGLSWTFIRPLLEILCPYGTNVDKGYATSQFADWYMYIKLPGRMWTRDMQPVSLPIGICISNCQDECGQGICTQSRRDEILLLLSSN